MPIPELYYSGMGDRFSRRLPARRIETMTILAWKVTPRLPKPMMGE
jgi:hypothetical protein